MWYRTKEEAEEACEWKRKHYGLEFYVVEDTEVKDCYWAQRLLSTP